MTQEKMAVTVAEAATLVAVGRSTGYALVASGEWPSITVGRSLRVPVEALKVWVERRMRTTEPPSTAALEDEHEGATDPHILPPPEPRRPAPSRRMSGSGSNALKMVRKRRPTIDGGKKPHV
jgi:excisionase family DNA binding protein